MKAITSSAIVASTTAIASGQFIDPNLSGDTQFDGWDTLNRSLPQIADNDAAWPTFPGATPWPEGIGSYLTFGTADRSDDDVTGDAVFNKTSGFGYPAGFSIYASPFGNGTFEVADNTVVSNIETVVFQIEIGTGSAPTALSGDPTLTINGTTQVALFNDFLLSSGVSDTGFGPVNVDARAYQWDLRGLGPITSFAVDFAPAGTSTTITALQLDQGNVFTAIPAPGAALTVGAAGVIAARRRRL